MWKYDILYLFWVKKTPLFWVKNWSFFGFLAKNQCFCSFFTVKVLYHMVLMVLLKIMFSLFDAKYYVKIWYLILILGLKSLGSKNWPFLVKKNVFALSSQSKSCIAWFWCPLKYVLCDCLMLTILWKCDILNLFWSLLLNIHISKWCLTYINYG